MDSRPVPGDDHSDNPEDVDARWAEIVAELGDLDDPDDDLLRDADEASRGGSARPAPDEGSTSVPPHRRRADDRDDAPGSSARIIRPAAPEPDDVEAGGEVPLGPRSWAPDPARDEADDHFVPPDPDPVLGGDPLLTLAWSAVLGVPLMALLVALFWHSVPDVVLQVAGAAFLLGVGLLFWRMPHHRDPDDDDTGAVV